jgi:hypothetical protein
MGGREAGEKRVRPGRCFPPHKLDEDVRPSGILARLQIQAIYRESTGNRHFRFFGPCAARMGPPPRGRVRVAQMQNAGPPLPASGAPSGRRMSAARNGSDRRTDQRLGLQPSPILRTMASERKKRSGYSCGARSRRAIAYKSPRLLPPAARRKAKCDSPTPRERGRERACGAAAKPNSSSAP